MASDWAAYETVLRDLRAQQAKLRTAIDAIEALRPLEEKEAGTPVPSKPPLNGAGNGGRFVGFTIVDASMKVMEEAGGPVHVGDILNAIVAGGVKVESGDKANTVGSMLNRRSRLKGDVQRVGRGTWALAEKRMSFANEVSEAPSLKDLMA